MLEQGGRIGGPLLGLGVGLRGLCRRRVFNLGRRREDPGKTLLRTDHRHRLARLGRSDGCKRGAKELSGIDGEQLGAVALNLAGDHGHLWIGGAKLLKAGDLFGG